MTRDPATIVAGFCPGESQHPPPAHCQPPIWLPIAFLLVGSFALRSFNLDLGVLGWFWSAKGGYGCACAACCVGEKERKDAEEAATINAGRTAGLRRTGC